MLYYYFVDSLEAVENYICLHDTETKKMILGRSNILAAYMYTLRESVMAAK